MIVKELSTLKIEELDNITAKDIPLKENEYIGLIYESYENKTFLDITRFNKTNKKFSNKIFKYWNKLLNRKIINYKLVIWKEEYRKGFELTEEYYEEVLDPFAGKKYINEFILIKIPENYYLKLYTQYFLYFISNVKINYGTISNPMKLEVDESSKKIYLEILKHKTKLLNEL